MSGSDVFLFRDDVRNSCAQGMLFAKGELFYTIERPWLGNASNISCIPADSYQSVFLPRSGSGKYKNVYYLRNVPGRGGILIHNGNLASHSKGCIIIGKRRGMLAEKPAVLNSRTALHEFVELMNHDPFKITIFGNQKLSLPKVA